MGDDSAASEGVLQMRCPALVSGYHNLPEVTAKALTGDGLYITGDVFRRDRDSFSYTDLRKLLDTSVRSISTT